MRTRLLLASMLLAATGASARVPNPLVQAGFRPMRATTPAQAAMLDRLPPGRFLRHWHGQAVAFAYADPSGCRCLYIGTARAFRRYQARVGDGIGGAEDHRDLLWDWDAWPVTLPGFNWGPALGW